MTTIASIVLEWVLETLVTNSRVLPLRLWVAARVGEESSECRGVGPKAWLPTSLLPQNVTFCKTGITSPNSVCCHEVKTKH